MGIETARGREKGVGDDDPVRNGRDGKVEKVNRRQWLRRKEPEPVAEDGRRWSRGPWRSSGPSAQRHRRCDFAG